jgi:hypothetical protein
VGRPFSFGGTPSEESFALSNACGQTYDENGSSKV